MMRLLALTAALLGVLLLFSVPAGAQTEGEERDGSMIIEIVSRPSSIDLTAHDAVSGRIAAFVGGVFCDLVELPVNQVGERPLKVGELVVGGAGQPAACSRVGATILLARADGTRLFEEFTFELGGRAVLSNFAPVLVHTGGPLLLPNAGSGGLVGAENGAENTIALALLAAGVGLVSGALFIRRRSRRMN